MNLRSSKSGGAVTENSIKARTSELTRSEDYQQTQRDDSKICFMLNSQWKNKPTLGIHNHPCVFWV